MKMTYQTAVCFFLGLVAFVAIGLNANGKGVLARTAEPPPVDCDINACFDAQWAHPAEGLFIWDIH
jgi:hypothetical protein